MTDNPTIFDRILSKEIPCHVLFEDEHVLAFLDVNPLARGHALLIPKERKAYLHELSLESATALGRALRQLARAVVAATGIQEYNILQNNGATANQSVFHVHFHMIPCTADEGLRIEWNTGPLKDPEILAESIRSHFLPQ